MGDVDRRRIGRLCVPARRRRGRGTVDIEVTQTLRGEKITLAAADTARVELGQLGVRRYPDAPLLHRAWELRDRCTTYDALYVALAEAFPASLVTRDARLARGVGDLVDVVVVKG